MSTSVSIGRISSWARPSGRFLSTAMRLRIVDFSIEPKARETSSRRAASASSSPVSGAYWARTASLIASIASWRASFSGTLVASSIALAWLPRICSTRPSSRTGASTEIFSLPAFCWSSSIAPTSFLISAWAMSRASRTSASVTLSAPHSTIRIASLEPETIRSISRFSCSSSDGLTTKSPSSLPTRTAPTCSATGTGEIASAAEAPFIARMS